MDPDQILKELRQAVVDLYSDLEFDEDDVRLTAEVLADKVAALDSWLTSGGFLPQDWTPKGN